VPTVLIAPDRSHRKKALHASNHDLKNFDEGQVHSTLPINAVALTFEQRRKPGSTLGRRDATRASIPLLAWRRLYFSEMHYCSVIALIAHALVVLPL
jgi:hypothetical protein